MHSLFSWNASNFFGILVSHHADKMKIIPLGKKNENYLIKNLNLKYFSYISIFLLCVWFDWHSFCV